MKVTKENLIELLNKDLALEYSAAIQYIQHAAVMTGAQFGDIIKDINSLLMKDGFKYQDISIGGFGSVHLFIAEKMNKSLSTTGYIKN